MCTTSGRWDDEMGLVDELNQSFNLDAVTKEWMYIHSEYDRCNALRASLSIVRHHSARPWDSSSSSSCPIGLSPVGANHLRDQIFPRLSVLREVEQVLYIASTPFHDVVEPLSARTSSARLSIHSGE